MQAPDPSSFLDQLFSCDTPMETDFSSVLASSDFSVSSAFSAYPGLSPWKLKEWKPSNQAPDSDSDEDLEDIPLDIPFDASLDIPLDASFDTPLNWNAWQFSLALAPLAQPFLPADLDADSLDLDVDLDLDSSSPECTEDPMEDIAMECHSPPFDMGTLRSALNVANSSKFQAKFHTKLHSRIHSKSHPRFQTTLQPIMEKSEESDSDSDSESKLSQKSSFVSQSTMDLRLGSSTSSISTNHSHALPWDPSKCTSQLREPSKTRPKLWDPFQETNSTEPSA